MKTVAIDGKTYQATSRAGSPAIRQINHGGGTVRWLPLKSDIGLRVMRALDIEPAMAPGFSSQLLHAKQQLDESN